jgi:hypothetical protein
MAEQQLSALIYSIRCQIARDNRAKGPTRRIEDRAEAVRALNASFWRLWNEPLRANTHEAPRA